MLRLLSVTLKLCMRFLIHCRCYKPSIVKKYSHANPYRHNFAQLFFIFVELCSIASVLQVKQHNMKTTNRKKDIDIIYSISLEARNLL